MLGVFNQCFYWYFSWYSKIGFGVNLSIFKKVAQCKKNVMAIISTSIIELLLSQKQCIITITYITFLVTISIAIALLFLVNYHALLASKTKVNVVLKFFFSKWASSSEMECQQQRKEKNSKNSHFISWDM